MFPLLADASRGDLRCLSLLDAWVRYALHTGTQVRNKRGSFCTETLEKLHKRSSENKGLPKTDLAF